MVFDAVAEGILPEETYPTLDMPKLLPAIEGREQYLLWRIRTRNVKHKYINLEKGRKVASAYGLPPICDEWKSKHGIYYAVINYATEFAGDWRF